MDKKQKDNDELNHFNADGDVHMVDVGDKDSTKRRAVASGDIQMQAATLQRIISGEHKKGDVLSVARVAGVMAAKKTADLIPLCHPLQLTHVDIALKIDEESHRVNCVATVETSGKTGVEMEAITAVQITLLTIYDMCKAMDKGMAMNNIVLQSKSGGKSGDWKNKLLR